MDDRQKAKHFYELAQALIDDIAESKATRIEATLIKRQIDAVSTMVDIYNLVHFGATLPTRDLSDRYGFGCRVLARATATGTDRGRA